MAQTIPQMFIEMVRQQPEVPVQLSKDKNGTFLPTSYLALLEQTADFAAGLKSLGIARGDRIGLISDNRKEWLAADLAILGIGAADVPRGCDATTQEVSFILSWSECAVVILENDKQLLKILGIGSSLPLLKTIIVFDPAGEDAEKAVLAQGFALYSFEEILAKGRASGPRTMDFYQEEANKGNRADLATLIYTSGTTGEPKGVMLSHGNFLHQTDYLPSLIGVKSGEVFLSVLPVWHSFERIVQYVILRAGGTIAYSKPVGSILLADMQAVQPHWFPSVPRIWESIRDGVNKTMKQSKPLVRALFKFFVGVGESYSYFRNHLLGLVPEFTPRSRVLEIAASIVPFLLLLPIRTLGDILIFRKIKTKLGKRFIAGVSGGGALPGPVDRFFNAIGVLILEGYGLTETAPVLGIRLRKHPRPRHGWADPPRHGYTHSRREGRNLASGQKGRHPGTRPAGHARVLQTPRPQRQDHDGRWLARYGRPGNADGERRNKDYRPRQGYDRPARRGEYRACADRAEARRKSLYPAGGRLGAG